MKLLNMLFVPIAFIIYIFRPETERDRGEAEAWRMRKRDEYIAKEEAKRRKS